MEKKRLSIIAIMLLLSVLNYFRIKGTEDVRAIEFLSIFVIGALTGVLLVGIISNIRNQK